MCKILCPICNRRICDVTTDSKEKVFIEMKCRHCNRIVKIEFPITAVLKSKTKTPVSMPSWNRTGMCIRFCRGTTEAGTAAVPGTTPTSEWN